jgi:hypothetical protein
MFHNFNIILGDFFDIKLWSVSLHMHHGFNKKNIINKKNRRIKKNFLNANFKTY